VARRASTFLWRLLARVRFAYVPRLKFGDVITPGTGSSTTSTVAVSTTGVIGGFTRLAFFRATFFAPGCLALATTFFGRSLVVARLVGLPRTELGDLRAVPHTVDFLFRPVTRFLR
jgi:hypothetical protein